jgi:membrane protease YdiL (CAAX protease family)
LDQLTVSLSPAPVATQSVWRTIFIGSNGIRAGWSVLIFFAIAAAEVTALNLVLKYIVHLHSPKTSSFGWVPGLIQEAAMLALLAVPVWVMSKIERKPIVSYGYRGSARFRRFVYELLWGFAAITSLVLALWKLGYLAFDGDVLHGLPAFEYAAAWGLVFLLVGLFEESFLRGYLQSTLTRGLGFWWAALILSTAFGLSHGTNAGESPIGLFTAGAAGLVFCISLWYTGSLWWAIGFHASWDWGESYFYGTADSGLIAKGHLFTEHSVGSLYWSGGATGPEGSILAVVLLAIIAALMVLWWGKRTLSPFAGNGWRPLRPAQSELAEPASSMPILSAQQSTL